MRYTKWFASIALAAGMAVAGTTAASAQDWRDVRRDSSRVDRMNADIARDRARLNEDIRLRPSAGCRAGRSRSRSRPARAQRASSRCAA